MLLRLEREVQTWNNSKVDVDDNQEVVGTDDPNNNNNSNNEWKETTSPRAGETNKGRGSPISSPTTILDF